MSKFLCPRCPKQFQSENDLKRHLKKIHGVERRMKGKLEANQSKPTEANDLLEKGQSKTLCYIIWAVEQLPLDKYQQMLNSRWVSLAEYQKLEAENKQLQDKNMEYAKLVAGQAEEYAERLSAIQTPEILEKLAELEHEQWMEWSKAIAPEINIGCYSAHLKRWNEWWVPYLRLTEEVKEYDRVWARKVLGVLLKESGEK